MAGLGDWFGHCCLVWRYTMSDKFYRVRIKRDLKLEIKHRRMLVQRVKDSQGDGIFSRSWYDKKAANREARLIESQTGVPMEVGEYLKEVEVF
jgi:hypothetical protein